MAKSFERELRTLSDQHERELRTLSESWERKFTDQQIHEVEALSHEHRLAHEREHEFTETAIATATTALNAELTGMNANVERLASQHPTFLTIAAYDRGHEGLIERMERANANLVERQTEDHETISKLVTQINTLRGIVIFLGLPGLAAILWIVLAVFTGDHAAIGLR